MEAHDEKSRRKSTRSPLGEDWPAAAPMVVVDDDEVKDEQQSATITPQSEEKPPTRTQSGQQRDVETASIETDLLRSDRSTAETVVLCILNLIPPLGVALSTRDGQKVFIALLLTLCLYLPGLWYAFRCMSRRSGRWYDAPCTLGL